MADPYETLGLAAGADDTTVRRRYLELVRQHPPERSPEKFAAICAAYEELRDPVKRLEHRLFQTHNNDSLDNIIADVRARLRSQRIPLDTLLSLAEG
jgi:curved DNA-binding protein CbpA